MALPSSGPISLLQIGSEFGVAAPLALSKFYGVASGIPASGTISLSHFYGKSNAFTLTISSSVASPDIHQLARNAGWGGIGPLLVNFNCPYINSLRLDGSKTFPGGLALNIMLGCTLGGVRGGGTALFTRVPVSVYGQGTIAGGGGNGGNGGDADVYYDGTTVRGWGGSGGWGIGFVSPTVLTLQAADTGARGSYQRYSGVVIGGESPWAQGGDGGDGGGWGAPGTNGSNASWGGAGSGFAGSGFAGQPAGLYVDGNSFVSWGAMGARLGRAAN